MDGIITTGNRYDEVYTTGGLLDPTKSGNFKEYQEVLFTSSGAEQRGINVGDTVMVNFYNYARPVQRKDAIQGFDEQYSQQLAFSIPTIDIDNKECLNLRCNDIVFIILEMEEQQEVSSGKAYKKKKNSKIHLLN